MLFLYEDHSFTFNVESVHLFLSTSRSKHLCELCIDSYIFAYCTYYITLCWQYPWDIHVTSWKQPLKLIFFCVASMLLLWIIALWVNSYARLIDACLEVLFMKSLCYMIHLFTHVIYIVLIAAFTTYALQIVWSRLWWHVTPEIICVIVLPARDEQN
jgi:hypothetical protein